MKRILILALGIGLAVRAMEVRCLATVVKQSASAERADPAKIFQRGQMALQQGDLEGAEADFRKVLQTDPRAAAQPRYLLGLCYSFVGQHTDAAKTLEPLWPQMSDQFVYLYVLGISAFYSGNKDLDQKATERLVEIGSDTPQFHLLMGKALMGHNDDQKALAELKKVEAVDANFPFLHFNLGLAYVHLQDQEKAESEFRKDISV